jgi:hypothetical protein
MLFAVYGASTRMRSVSLLVLCCAAFERTVEAALQTGQRDAIATAVASYVSHHEAHLKHEEDQMMPLIPRLPDYPERVHLLRSACMTPGLATGDFDHFVGHCVQSLSSHGSAKNSPQTATRGALRASRSLLTLTLASALIT